MFSEGTLLIGSLCTFNQPFVIFVCEAGCGLFCLTNLTVTRSMTNPVFFVHFLCLILIVCNSFQINPRCTTQQISTKVIQYNQTHFDKIILSWCLCLSWVCICSHHFPCIYIFCICSHHFPPSVKRDDSHTPIPYLSVVICLFVCLFVWCLCVMSNSLNPIVNWEIESLMRQLVHSQIHINECQYVTFFA